MIHFSTNQMQIKPNEKNRFEIQLKRKTKAPVSVVVLQPVVILRNSRSRTILKLVKLCASVDDRRYVEETEKRCMRTSSPVGKVVKFWEYAP